MRDEIMPKQYFDKYIDKRTEMLLKYNAAFEKGEVKEERVKPVKYAMSLIEEYMLIARYSRGDNICEIKEMYENIFEKWIYVFEPDNYNRALRMLSIGICLETEKKNIIRVYNLLQKSKKEDWLLEFLACTYIGEEFDNNIKLLFKKEYEKFKDFIENSRNPSDLKQILKKGWYNSRRENYDSHNRSDYTYCGYWSFEAGAIVKLLGIDDTILKDMKYYPYDLVHYKEERDGIIQ